MSQSSPGKSLGVAEGPRPSAWSPSVRSAPYLPKQAPSWPGAWHLPQVRAQAMGALIEDVGGWARNLHAGLALAVGCAGAGALLLAADLDPPTRWVLLGSGGVLLVVCVLWAVWLERSGWLAIGALGRWHAAYVRGTGASGQIETPSVTNLFTAALVVRVVLSLASLGAGAWAVLQAVSAEGLDRWGFLALAGVCGAGGIGVIVAAVAAVLAMVNRPSPQARRRAVQQSGWAGGGQQGESAPGSQHVSAADQGEGAQPANGASFAPPGASPSAAVAPQHRAEHSHGPPGSGQPGHGQPGPAYPGYGQPFPGQPGVGLPGSPPPGYGHPGPGQPGYGQPDFRQPGHGQPVGPGFPARHGPASTGGFAPPAADGHTPAGAPPSSPDSPVAPHADLHGIPEGGLDPDADLTRLAQNLGPIPTETSTRSPIRSGVVVRLADGRYLPRDAHTLLGRDPKTREGEEVDAVLKVADQSVSKTHLGVRVTGNKVFLTDRASTNGTEVTGPDGVRRELEPWTETEVHVGSTVHIGSAELLVRLPEDAE